MSYQILFIFLSLLSVSMLVNHITLTTLSGRFSNQVINLLLLISGYAIFITSGKSVFIIPVLLIIAYLGFTKKIKINIIQDQWLSTITYTTVVFLFFVFLFYRNSELLITHEDYLFWIRSGLINNRIGTENTNVFYNLFGNAFRHPDLYHHLEIWAMNFGSFINRQSASYNLLFFAYPITLVTICFGIKELLKQTFTKQESLALTKDLSVLLIILMLLFFSHPWDSICTLLGASKLPISGMKPIWLTLKSVYVLVVVVSLLLYLKKPDTDRLMILLFSSFFYLPVLPLLLLSLFIWQIYLWFFHSEKHYFQTTWILITLILFVGFYSLLGSKGGSTISGFSIKEWLIIKNWIKYIPAIFMKTILIPLIGFLPVLFYYFRRKNLFSKSTHFFFILFLTCIGVWFAFVKNIDANQSYLLIFGTLLPFMLCLTVLHFINERKKIVFTLTLFIYFIPGIYESYNFQSPIEKDNSDTKSYIKQLGNNKLLYLPDSSEMNNVYSFNEKVYTGINQFILYNNELDIFSVASSVITDTNQFSNSSKMMYEFYRDNAVYYKECGYVDIQSGCFFNFLKENNIHVLCTRTNKPMPPNWRIEYKDEKHCFYTDL